MNYQPELVLSENAEFIAFLEENPLTIGHVVVIPKRKEDHFFDLTDAEISGIMVFAKKISHAMKKKISCEKIGVAILGLQTRHAHVHLVPITTPDDLNFTRPKRVVPPESLEALAAQIRTVL